MAHGPLQPLAENLFKVEGSLPSGPLGRVMVIAKMNDGGLVIHNAITLDDMSVIEALGTPKYLVVPNGWHRLDAPAFKRRWPALKVITPPRGKKRVEKVVPVDMTFDQFPGDESVKLEMLDGLGGYEGVMHVQSSDGTTLVVADAIFNLPKISGFQGILYHHIMGSKPGPRVSRIGRLMLVKDKNAYRANLLRLAALPDLRRVIMAHGAQGDRETLRTAATTF